MNLYYLILKQYSRSFSQAVYLYVSERAEENAIRREVSICLCLNHSSRSAANSFIAVVKFTPLRRKPSYRICRFLSAPLCVCKQV